MSVGRNSTIGIGPNDEQGAAAMLLGQQADGSTTLNGVRTIATGDLRDQVLTADGASVLVSDASGIVTRYDLATGASTGSWQVGTSLGGMTVTGDGHFLYATELTPVTFAGPSYPNTSNIAELDRLDLQTGTVTHIDLTVSDTTTTVFRDVAMESNGNLLLTSYTPNVSGYSNLYEYSPQTGTISSEQASNVGYAYDGALQATPDGNHILITDIGVSSADVKLLTVSADSAITSYGPDNNGANGATAITASGSLSAHSVDQFSSSSVSDDVLVYNSALQVQADLRQVAPQAIGDTAVTGLAFSADGSHLFVLNTALNAVVELSTSTWATEAVIPVQPLIHGPTYTYAGQLGYDAPSSLGDALLASSDGHYLSVSNGGSVQVIDLTQTTPTPVLTTLTFPTALTIGPDGGNLFITAGATDATSTVQSVTITLDHAIATANGPETQVTFSADHDPYDDGFSASNIGLTEAASGTYTVIAATVTDAAGHSLTYNASMLAALLPATSFTVTAEQDLTNGDDVYHDTAGHGLIVYGLDGNDTLYGSSTTDTLDGGAGDDLLVQGGGSTTFVGGEGYDTVVLGGVASDYYETHDNAGDDILFARDASSMQTISPDVEQVQFGDGSHLSADNQPASDYSIAGTVTGNYMIDAPASGSCVFNGGAGDNEVFLPGTVSDYTLSRGSNSFGSSSEFFGDAGNFELAAKNGHAAYSFDESVDVIHFANGQYLALKDLPSYVAGDASLALGSDQSDILYQVKPSGYEAFYGGAGNDDLYLKGNVADYTVRAFHGELDPDFGRLSGLELIGNNGSGALFIDQTVNTVHFQNGQYLAFSDIAAYVAAAPSSDANVHIVADGADIPGSYLQIDGAGSDKDLLLVDGNVTDYALSRSYDGSFVLADGTSQLIVAQDVETIQFGNGQYLSLHDLPAYLSGNATFTYGTAEDDLLFVGSGGDQYVYGGSGQDNLYIHGNVGDYTLQQVPQAYNPSGPAITGVELVADNGSGNIYIDQSVETVHFQNGQYLAFNDLSHYIG